ncbi:MAG: chromate efflux transporter [Rhizobiales bacterium]|nr:chromate efflux transporter [Hyphomicrobiales bacterium]
MGEPPRFPTLAEAARVWARVAALSFGGPAGQIAVMHRIVVEEKRWVSERRFLHALNACTLLPGPEAMELATYVGWLMHRVKGGLIAGLLFVAPGALAIWALSMIYVIWGKLPLVEGLFFGLKAAVLAIVLEAALRIGRRALRSGGARALAVAAFVAVAALGAPFPAVVAGAALIGYGATRMGSAAFAGAGHGATTADEAPTALGEGTPDHARPSARRDLAIAAICIVAWLAPVAALALWRGGEDRLTQLGVFFSKMAVVTFGGAYAVLAYVGDVAAQSYGWITPGEMLDGLGMAETTPGPLIMVLQFVGFLAAHRAPGDLDPLVAGTLGAAIATWTTFAPCFLWIFAGGPWFERLRASRPLAGALAGVTAAVVGVILNLALWFALHTLFAAVGRARLGPLALDWPAWSSLNPWAAALTALALALTFGARLGMGATLAICAALGVGLRMGGWA